jgi:hypothetical protein
MEHPKFEGILHFAVWLYAFTSVFTPNVVAGQASLHQIPLKVKYFHQNTCNSVPASMIFDAKSIITVTLAMEPVIRAMRDKTRVALHVKMGMIDWVSGPLPIF